MSVFNKGSILWVFTIMGLLFSAAPSFADTDSEIAGLSDKAVKAVSDLRAAKLKVSVLSRDVTLRDKVVTQKLILVGSNFAVEAPLLIPVVYLFPQPIGPILLRTAIRLSALALSIVYLNNQTTVQRLALAVGSQLYLVSDSILGMVSDLSDSDAKYFFPLAYLQQTNVANQTATAVQDEVRKYSDSMADEIVIVSYSQYHNVIKKKLIEDLGYQMNGTQAVLKSPQF